MLAIVATLEPLLAPLTGPFKAWAAVEREIRVPSIPLLLSVRWPAAAPPPASCGGGGASTTHHITVADRLLSLLAPRRAPPHPARARARARPFVPAHAGRP